MPKPYYQDNCATIYHGDCLEIMPELEPVNLIPTDPPYNINKAEWDKIPDYLEWYGKWLLACQDTLKDNGSFCFFHNDIPTIARLITWIEENTRFVFKQFITWNKYFQGSKNEGFCKRRLSNNESRNFYGAFTEYCLFYTFQNKTGLAQIYNNPDCFKPIRTYLKKNRIHAGLSVGDINIICGTTINQRNTNTCNAQWCMITEERYQKLQKACPGYFQRPYEDLRHEYEDLRREYEALRYTFNNQKVMTVNFNSQNWNNNVWNYEIADKVGHITPKPIDLISNIILHSSNKGDTVLDPFMGSGTTLVAAKQLNRKAIGIDIKEKYCEIAANRIEKAIKHDRMSFHLEKNKN